MRKIFNVVKYFFLKLLFFNNKHKVMTIQLNTYRFHFNLGHSSVFTHVCGATVYLPKYLTLMKFLPFIQYRTKDLNAPYLCSKSVSYAFEIGNVTNGCLNRSTLFQINSSGRNIIIFMVNSHCFDKFVYTTFNM